MLVPVPVDDTSLGELRLRTSAKWRAYPAEVLPAWVAEMDFTVAEPIADALHRAVDRSDTGYRWAEEIPVAFAAFADGEWSWQVDPKNVIVLADVMSAIAQSLLHLTEPGSQVVINPPVYPPFFSTVEKVTGRVVREVPLVADSGRYRLDLEGLQRAFADPAVQAFVLCSPHNPTGTVHSHEDLTAVAALAAVNDVVVISDEIHAPMALAGSRHVPFMHAATDIPHLRAVAAVSASKAWNIPGLKCAQLVAGASVVDELNERIPIEATYGVGHFGVLGTLAAYRDGASWRAQMLTALDDRRRTLFDALTAMDGVEMVWPEASFLAWVRFESLGDDPAAVILDEASIAVNSGPAFGAPGLSHARINYATSREILEAIIAGVGAVVGSRAS